MLRRPDRAFRGAVATALTILLTLPAAADTLSDALIEAYRNSPLLEQQRYLLRATQLPFRPFARL